MKIQLLLIMMIGVGLSYAQPSYKEMMYDPSVNFYDVVKAAEAYFETHGTGEGSGYKGFQRWRSANESKYYPTGDRSLVDPYFVEKAYWAFQSQPTHITESVFEGGWRDLGPYDANNITSHYSPGIGRVESFWVNPANDQHIYMGSRSGGFWRTTDGGNTWLNSTDTLPASGVNTMTVDPLNPNSVLINVQNALNNASHGLYQSADGGLTWTQSNFNP
ncbi:MAG: hypothetical protein KDD99_10440, partial [Bacteroidetes bacterium]|nr:hypothetical protein [Bacteroidota bacterium]